jgi:hypothetical protein
VKWWLRENRLKTASSEPLKKFAFDLIVSSESVAVLGGDASAVIANAARSLNLDRAI